MEYTKAQMLKAAANPTYRHSLMWAQEDEAVRNQLRAEIDKIRTHMDMIYTAIQTSANANTALPRYHVFAWAVGKATGDNAFANDLLDVLAGNSRFDSLDLLDADPTATAAVADIIESVPYVLNINIVEAEQ